KNDLSYRKSAQQLYDRLFKPAMTNLLGIDTLIIIPDDVLWKLPFQALLTPNNRFLIEDYTISYTPSLAVLRETMKKESKQLAKQKSSLTLLAFGNPTFDGENEDRFRYLLQKLEPLPNAKQEVIALQQIYGRNNSVIYLGKDATEEHLKAWAERCTILHIATHGIVNSETPMYSKLVLAQPTEGSAEDGLLEAWEILNLDLNAELVVLSACDTAIGKIEKGEGVIGLVWALLISGCPTTVVSQWKVADLSTKEFMKSFHLNLKPRFTNGGKRIMKASALRQAALTLIRDRRYRHPLFWAAFTMIGNGY
ncbi:MAG: CHAT domain-containing protein, partial [Acidobacteriota bacterium]